MRPLTEVTVTVGGGFQVAGRAGYQARDFTSGGPSFGLSGAYAF